MTACTDPAGEWELLVQADHDRELDAATAARVAGHLKSCPHCAAWAAGLADLSARIAAEPVEQAPPTLRRAAIVRANRRPSRRHLLTGAAAALAASLALVLIPRGPASDPDAALVDSHVRALQPGHLIDVPSSDRHTVKPWFDGKLDFAPPVRDLSAAGYTLEGGRLDYIDARPAAVLIYRHAAHPIDLYIHPGTAPAAAPTLRSLRGYVIVTWSDGGMTYRAIADTDAEELRAFAKAWNATGS